MLCHFTMGLLNWCEVLVGWILLSCVVMQSNWEVSGHNAICCGILGVLTVRGCIMHVSGYFPWHEAIMSSWELHGCSFILFYTSCFNQNIRKLLYKTKILPQNNITIHIHINKRSYMSMLYYRKNVFLHCLKRSHVSFKDYSYTLKNVHANEKTMYIFQKHACICANKNK
jgi:3-hydroxymyristoyl/3-hydroxydecanoyl-(acyl carrier protein) dehydratase